MRDIKFRAWDKKTKKFMFPWPEGFYLFGETTCFDIIGQQFEAGEDRLLRYNDVEIIQYTGLKDGGGRDIYEGDIIAWGMVICHVLWDTKLACFMSHQDIPGDVMDNYLYTCPQYIVIGNVYENPELLKENGDEV